jgi:hypothetical protein
VKDYLLLPGGVLVVQYERFGHPVHVNQLTDTDGTVTVFSKKIFTVSDRLIVVSGQQPCFGILTTCTTHKRLAVHDIAANNVGIIDNYDGSAEVHMINAPDRMVVVTAQHQDAGVVDPKIFFFG